MADSGVKVTIDKVQKFLSSVKKLAESRVMVGIPAENAVREGEPINNAALGYIHEFGAPGANIPARAFLRPGVANEKVPITKHLQAAGQAALEGKASVVDKHLNAAGLLGQRGAQRKITDGPFVPLSPRTIYARQHRKVAPRKGDKPLIDTGQLRASITYVIRKGVRK